MPVTPTPYDPSAGGPSAAATMDQLKAVDDRTLHFDQTEKTTQQGFNALDYTNVTKPALQSSLGAAGQAGSSAGQMATSMQGAHFDQSQYALQHTFDRAQDDMTRQQAFAAMGLTLQ